MNRILFSCLLLALCIISTYAAAPPLPVCNHNPPNAYMVELPPNFISAVQAFLPEGKAVATSLLSTKAWNPNFLFDFTDTPGFTEAYIDVSILWEGAGYRNQFGYFTYTVDNKGNAKVVKEVVLYDDVSFPDSGSDYKTNPACLQPGVSTRIGPFTQGQRVGWFCYPDRVRTNSKTTLYSEETLNQKEATGEVHVLVASLQDQYIVGIEDIAPLKNADRDYNDIVFKASTTKAGKITVPVIPADCKDPYCNGRGTCNKTTLACNCATTSSTSYYSGDSCEIITPCAKPCGAGICTPSGCVCDKTRFSDDCTACATDRYVFPTCDPCPKDCKKGCNPDGSCYIPPPPPPPNPPPTCLSKPFLIASDYQVFVSGAFSGVNADITTRLAAGGDVTLTQYSLGEALALDDNFNCASFGASDNKNTLVAGGNLNFDSGNVRVGNIIYGGNPAIGAGVSGSLAAGCVAAKGSVIDFASTFTWLNGLSRTFKNYGSNGKVYKDNLDSDKLVFQAPVSAPSNNNYVWNVDAATLSAAKSLTFLNVPTTAAILIINVASDKGRFTFSDASLEFILTSGLSSRLVWNFYDTRSLTIQRIGLAGAILAPFASVSGTDSVVWGNIFAASFSGSTQVNDPLETIQPCILSNIKIDVDDGSCPPCIGDSVAGSGCRCTCPTLPKCAAPLVADPSGACQCVCNANPNCPLGVDANCNCITASIPTLSGQCRQDPFGWLSDFQIATQGLTTISSAYIGGRAATGGALSLTRVSLGLDLVKTPTDDCSVSGYSYVSAGAAAVVAGNVVGNIAHGSSCQFSYSIAVPPFPRPAYCEFPLYDPSLFQSGGKFSIGDAFGGTIIPISAALADPNAIPTTGIYVKSNDIITLFGANTAFEVFSIDATDLANTRRIDVRGLSSASTIIINIVGSTSVSISKIGLQSLVPFSRLLIWNAPSATIFSATNVALPGYVLAPSASITNPVGQIIGGVFASSLRAKGNIYLPWLGRFAGCIPNDLSSKACPACAPGTARQDTTCNCYSVVSLSAVVTNDFGFNTGYSVKYTVNNKHSKSLSGISVTFPQDPACPLQLGADGVTPQVFSLNQVAGAQYATPSWTGFSADGYSFIALFYNAAGTCNSKKPVVPTIAAVSF